MIGTECSWRRPRVWAIGHGPMGHGVANQPARCRRSPDCPKGHRQWPARDTLLDRLHRCPSRPQDQLPSSVPGRTPFRPRHPEIHQGSPGFLAKSRDALAIHLHDCPHMAETECSWRRPRVWAIGHGPMGHGIAPKPAGSRRSPDCPKGHRQWPARDTLTDSLHCRQARTQDQPLAAMRYGAP